MTDFPVCYLRSVEIEVPDLLKSEIFYTNAWGLSVVAREPGSVYLRASGAAHHVLALHEAPSPALRCVVFRTADRDALDRVIAAGVASGCAQIDCAPDPAGGTLRAMREPGGMQMRLVHADRLHGDAASVPGRPLRLAHINVNSTDVDATALFYEQVLGFRLTDRSKIMAFVRCNADHHAVVITEAAAGGLNHVAFLMPDLESVMRGSGRVIDHGTPIGWGVGRHGPGDNVFAYFVDPLGFVVEYTAEVLQVDDAYRVRGPAEWTWPPGRVDHWGIAPPKPDFVKKAQLAVPFA